MSFLFVPAAGHASDVSQVTVLTSEAASEIKAEFRRVLANMQEPPVNSGLRMRYTYTVQPRDSAQFERQEIEQEIISNNGRSLMRSGDDLVADDKRHYVVVSHAMRRIIVREWPAEKTSAPAEQPQTFALLRDSLLQSMRVVHDEVFEQDGRHMRRVKLECAAAGRNDNRDDNSDDNKAKCREIAAVTAEWDAENATITRMHISHTPEAESSSAWVEIQIHELEYDDQTALEPALNLAFERGKLRAELAGYHLLDLRREAR